MNLLNLYFITSIIFSIFFIGMGIYVLKFRIKNNGDLCSLSFVTGLTILFQGFAVITNKPYLALIFYGCYFILFEFLLVSICGYICKVTYSKYRIPILIILYILCIIMGIIFVLNNYNHLLFYLDYVPLIGDNYSYEVCFNNLFILHIILCNIISLVSYLLLITRCIYSSKFYRIPYVVLIVLYTVIVCFNNLYNFNIIQMDISVMLYCLLSFAIIFFDFYYIPSYTIKKLENVICDSMGDMILGFNREWKCIYKNSSSKSILSNEDIVKLYNGLSKKINDNINECSFEDKRVIDGIKKYYIINFKKIFDEDGRIICYLVIIHDNTNQVLKNKKEYNIITYDRLTNLYNKDKFFLEVEQLLHKQNDKKFVILCTDVKNFKIINDIYGSRIGDEILLSIAEIIDKKFKGNKNVVYGRLSSDNFVICMPKSEFKKNILRKDFNKIRHIIDKKFEVYVYMGVYEVVDNTLPVSLMCDNAKFATESIKNDFTNYIGYYDDSYKDKIIKEQKIVSKFYKALSNGEFELYIQPQVSNDKRIIGGEVLVRWNNNEEVLLPSEFIPVLEKVGLISRLDCYIWEESVKKIKEWEDNDYYLSINISPTDFMKINVYEYLVKLVEKYKIDVKRLKLEITETAFINNSSDILNIIDSLRDYGFIIEMDDFGSGYSSLNLLKDINVDVLKLDMEFLNETKDTNKAKIIIDSVVSLAKKLNLEVVIEGVEKKTQFDYLYELGCDIYQGYYFGKPCNIKDFEKKIK